MPSCAKFQTVIRSGGRLRAVRRRDLLSEGTFLRKFPDSNAYLCGVNNVDRCV